MRAKMLDMFMEFSCWRSFPGALLAFLSFEMTIGG
jgi:hypothetical protein